MRRATLACLLGFAAATAAAAERTDMVLGRMVMSRESAPSVATTQSPRADYVLHCSGCHRVDGSGAPEKYVPDLRQLGAFLRVEGGRQFVIQVPGVMGSGLDDRGVAGVVNWLLGTLARDSVPAGLAPYTAAEVARARAQPLVDVAGARAQLVQQARAQGVALQ